MMSIEIQTIIIVKTIAFVLIPKVEMGDIGVVATTGIKETLIFHRVVKVS